MKLLLVLLLCQPLFAQPSPDNSVWCNGGLANPIPSSCTLNSASIAGHPLFAAFIDISAPGSGHLVTSISGAATWAYVSSYAGSSGYFEVWRGDSATGGTSISVTYNGTPSQGNFYVVSFGGTGAADGNTGSCTTGWCVSASGSSMSTGTVNWTAGDLVLGIGAVNCASSSTAGSGYTILQQQAGIANAVEYGIAPGSSGTVTMTNAGGVCGYGMLAVTVKAAATTKATVLIATK